MCTFVCIDMLILHIARAHILVVDDNTVCQSVLKIALSQMAIKCHVAWHGAIAVSMVSLHTVPPTPRTLGPP